jgi:hypothetical protein
MWACTKDKRIKLQAESEIEVEDEVKGEEEEEDEEEEEEEQDEEQGAMQPTVLKISLQGSVPWYLCLNL